MKTLIITILCILLCHAALAMGLIHLLLTPKKTVRMNRAVSHRNSISNTSDKKKRFEKLKIFFGHKIYEWKDLLIKVPKNSLQPMSTIKVEACSPRHESGIYGFEANIMLWKEHRRREEMATKEK
jgi:hypothetical protein